MNSIRVINSFKKLYDSVKDKSPEVIEWFGILDEVISEWRQLKHEKYTHRWHDLEANPDDLPEDLTDVYVYYEYFRYGGYNRPYRTYGVGFFDDGKCNFVNGQSGWKKLKILAWKEIEEFKGDA